jgi:hypothetical protein
MKKKKQRKPKRLVCRTWLRDIKNGESFNSAVIINFREHEGGSITLSDCNRHIEYEYSVFDWGEKPGYFAKKKAIQLKALRKLITELTFAADWYEENVKPEDK